MNWNQELNEPTLQELYGWIDKIPLSKPRRKIERDFSDGILIGEIIHNYFPHLIDMHNYVATGSFNQKKGNWETLNRKVFSHFGINLPEKIIIDLCNAKTELELQQQHSKHQQSKSLPRQPLLSSKSIHVINDNKRSFLKETNRISRSTINLTDKTNSRHDYEQLKQHYLQQQQDIQILQVKIRRLEHFVQIKDTHTTKNSENIQNNHLTKSNHILNNKFIKK